MKITKNIIDECMERTREKITWWNEKYPSINFNEYGRAVIGTISAFDNETIASELGFTWSASYRMAFQKYLSDENMAMKDYGGSYNNNIYRTRHINYKDFVENKFYFMREGGKKVSIKASRVLAKVHAIWMDLMPVYKELIKDIKRLRAEGATFANSQDLVKLTSDKSKLENGNLSVAYENMLNDNAGTRNVYLSINPLDKLTSSGCSGSNPTKFSSCWSLEFRESYDDWRVIRDGGYSNPEAQIAIGSVLNCGIIYIPNENTIDILGFPFIGYKERTHCWLDSDGIFLERMYPTKSSSRLREILNGVKNTFPIKDKVEEFQLMEYQDYKNVKKYVSESNNTQLFFDRIGIDKESNRIFYLIDNRLNYDYQNGDSYPEDSITTCSCCGGAVSRDGVYYDHDDNEICGGCYDSDFFTCERCSGIHHVDNLNEIGDHYFCSHCASIVSVECDDCGERILIDDASGVYRNNREIYVCEWCVDNYSQCDDCSDYHHNDEMETTSDGNYCSNCIDDHRDEESDAS